eukprot:1918640-Pleurochrysis_carterae.AAC.1
MGTVRLKIQRTTQRIARFNTSSAKKPRASVENSTEHISERGFQLVYTATSFLGMENTTAALIQARLRHIVEQDLDGERAGEQLVEQPKAPAVRVELEARREPAREKLHRVEAVHLLWPAVAKRAHALLPRRHRVGRHQTRVDEPRVKVLFALGPCGVNRLERRRHGRLRKG